MSIKIEVGKRYNSAEGEVYILGSSVVNGVVFYVGHVKAYDLTRRYDESGKNTAGYHLISEHKEPFKNEITGWVGHADNLSDGEDDIISVLFNRSSSSYFHKEKSQVPLHWKKSMHVKIMVEEIID